MESLDFSVKDKKVTPSQFSRGKWHLTMRDAETVREVHHFLKFWVNVQRLDIYWKEGMEQFKFFIGESFSDRIEKIPEIHLIFPKSLKSLAWIPLQHCKGLKSINIPNDNLTFTDNPIEREGLQVDLPENAVRTRIENGMLIVDGMLVAGLNCDSIVNVPESVTTYAKGAFSGCKSIEEFVVPKNMAKIPNYMFSGCSGLRHIEFPEWVNSIGDHAFGGCSGLTSVDIPSNVTDIGYGAFMGCCNLESAVLYDGMTKIPSCLFSMCHHLKTVVIPDSVTEIGNQAFYHCLQLRHPRVTQYMIDGKDEFEEIRAVNHTPDLSIKAIASTFTDTRDGYTYKTVKIGPLEWFAENLRYKCNNAVAYDSDEANVAKYGLLYDMTTAAKCAPTGWRLPTLQEILNLFEIAGGTQSAASLKSKDGWETPDSGYGGNGKDLFGLCMLPAGYRFHPAIGFIGMGRMTYLWTSTEKPNGKGTYYRFAYNDDLAHFGEEYKSALMSVRYVRDNAPKHEVL